jgi:hypothetical protein
MQSLQRVDKAEPAHEPLVRAALGAKPSAYRLAVETHVEPHAHHAVLIAADLLRHEFTVGLRHGWGVGELPDVDPDLL